MTGTTGSSATAVAAGDSAIGLAGEEEVTVGGSEDVTAGGGGVGLEVRMSLPLVAQPASPVQQVPNANQKVADLFESRMLKNLQGSRQFR